jgi:excisionase family DNA binding protein
MLPTKSDGPHDGDAVARGGLPRLIPLADVATYFGKSERTLRRWISDGHLPAVKIGPAIYVRECDLIALLDRQLMARIGRTGSRCAAEVAPGSKTSVNSDQHQ